MHRRDALGLFGGAVAGLTTGSPLLADHPAKADPAMPAGPLGQFHAYLCAYHLAKKDVNFVLEAHHYCAALSDEVHQCVIFDKVGKGARILGVEYIISDRLYRAL